MWWEVTIFSILYFCRCKINSFFEDIYEDSDCDKSNVLKRHALFMLTFCFKSPYCEILGWNLHLWKQKKSISHRSLIVYNWFYPIKFLIWMQISWVVEWKHVIRGTFLQLAFFKRKHFFKTTHLITLILQLFKFYRKYTCSWLQITDE